MTRRSQDEPRDDAEQDLYLALQYIDLLADKLDEIDRACATARTFLHHLQRVVK